jgi:hypothetical protein
MGRQTAEYLKSVLGLPLRVPQTVDNKAISLADVPTGVNEIPVGIPLCELKAVEMIV